MNQISRRRLFEALRLGTVGSALGCGSSTTASSAASTSGSTTSSGFSDGTQYEMATLTGSVGASYTATLTIGVSVSA